MINHYTVIVFNGKYDLIKVNTVYVDTVLLKAYTISIQY